MFLMPEEKLSTLWEGFSGWRTIEAIIGNGDRRQEVFLFPRVNDRWKSSSHNRWLCSGQSFG